MFLNFISYFNLTSIIYNGYITLYLILMKKEIYTYWDLNLGPLPCQPATDPLRHQSILLIKVANKGIYTHQNKKSNIAFFYIGWNSDTHVNTVQIKLVLKATLIVLSCTLMKYALKPDFKTNFMCTVLTCITEYQSYFTHISRDANRF